MIRPDQIVKTPQDRFGRSCLYPVTPEWNALRQRANRNNNRNHRRPNGLYNTTNARQQGNTNNAQQHGNMYNASQPRNAYNTHNARQPRNMYNTSNARQHGNVCHTNARQPRNIYNTNSNVMRAV